MLLEADVKIPFTGEKYNFTAYNAEEMLKIMSEEIPEFVFVFNIKKPHNIYRFVNKEVSSKNPLYKYMDIKSKKISEDK